MAERKAMEGTLAPLEDEEEVGEEEEAPLEVIWVKLPNGNKIAMVAPYDDEGDVKWLVPRDPRDLDYFEIPWDLLIDEKYRQNQRGRLVVVSSQPVDGDWLNRINDEEPHPEAIYKSSLVSECRATRNTSGDWGWGQANDSHSVPTPSPVTYCVDHVKLPSFRYDTFNGRHIIEALLSKKIPKPPRPEDLDEKDAKGKKRKKGDNEGGKETEGEEEDEKEKEENEDDEELKTESEIAKGKKKPEPPPEQKTPKELLLEWAADMRKNLVHSLVEKIREKQHFEEEKAPRVIKWMNSAIKREETAAAMKKARRERMRRMRTGLMEPSKIKYIHGEMDEELDEVEAEAKDRKKDPDLTSLDVNLQDDSDVDLDKSVTDLSVQRSLDRLGEDEEILSGFGEEEEDTEQITLNDMEAEENFLKKIKRRAKRVKKKRYKEMAMTLKKLRKQLEDKCKEIEPPAEYFEAVDEVLRNEEDLFQGWEPLLVFPRDLCLALPTSSGRWFDCTCDSLSCSGAPSRFPKECIRQCDCREKKGTVTFTFKGEPFAVTHPCGRFCKCQKYDITRGNSTSNAKSNSMSPGATNGLDGVLEKKYRPRGCLLGEDFSDSDVEAFDKDDLPEPIQPSRAKFNSVKETVNQFRTVFARDTAAFRRYLRSGKDTDQVPKHERERGYLSPFSLKPFERKSLYTEWLEKQKTIVDRIVMNENTAKAAYMRGWTKSPYYQFGVDSGLLMPPVDKEDEERIAKFKRSPGYEAKYNEYGKILEEGLYSEEKAQELVVLGVAHTDPFLKDFLDFTKTELELNESRMTELQALVEEDPDAYAQLMPISVLNEDEEEENEDENWKQKEQDTALRSLIEERLNPNLEHWKGTKTKQFSIFWDEKDFLRRSIIKEKRRKELTGELPLKSSIDDESLKKLFIQNFDKIWVLPENFKKILSKNNWKPGKPESKQLNEFGEFLKEWRESWISLVDSVRDAAGKERKKRLYARMVKKSEMFVKAFSRRLEEYKVIGEPQPFLVERLGRSDKEKHSYLSYLKKMRKAFVKNRKIDKQKIQSALNFLEGILETIDTAKEPKSEQKVTSASKMRFAEEENLEEEEGELKQKSKTNVGNIHTAGKEFKLMFNKLYTSKDLARGDFSKGPVIVDKELIDMDAQQVMALYKQHNIKIENIVDPFVVYNEWRGFFPSKKKAEFTCVKVHCGLKPKRTNAITHYMSLLHAAHLIEDDPYDIKFSPKKFRHYVQPVSDVMKYVDLSLLKDVIRSQPKPPSQQKKDTDDGNKSQVFNEEILNAWRALKMPMIDRTPAESRTGSRDETSRASSQKMEDIVSMKSLVTVDPYYCKKIRAWKRVIYDPYACLRALPRIGKRERSWYRSAMEREMRAFRRKNKSFLKYLNMKKLKEDPDNFKVWKMIASGSLFCKYMAVAKERTSHQEIECDPSLAEAVNEESAQNCVQPDEKNSRPFKKAIDEFRKIQEFKVVERMLGDGELWNWEVIGASNNGSVESAFLDDLLGFKMKHFKTKYDVLTQGEKKQKFIKNIRKLFKHSLPKSCEGANRLKRPVKGKKPENFVVFTTVKLPPFAERLEQNSSRRIPENVDQKVEDRKLFKLLRSCGTLIFDITRSRHDMHICSWYLRKLYIKMERVEQKWQNELRIKRNSLNKDIINEIETRAQDHRLCDVFHPKQHIILITSFVSWANSPTDVKTHINEKNFWKRKPHQDYYDYYTFENLLYRIGKYMPFNLRTTIVYSGLPFGCEEDGLSYVFKMAYENKREIPIFGPGDNYPPMVHITDLSKVIASLVLPEYYLPMTCLVQPIKLSLKRRVYNIASQVSYAHVRTQPTSYYEWNNILPKSVHDMLQLHVRAADVDLHELMGSPTIAKPFSAGSRGYQLFQELTQSRGTHCISVVLLGPPNAIKSDLAKAISVFYGIPLITRRNILSEWLKLKLLILEGKALRKTYHKTAIPEEGGKDDVPKRPQFGPEEMKSVVSDRNNCDVNRCWLLFTLKFILRTKRYRRVGYVLCDMPMSEKDADFLFNNKNREPDPREFRNVSMYVRLPDKVIKVETDLTDFHGGRSFAEDPILFDDMKEYYRLQAGGKGAEAFFQKRLLKIHRVNVQDEFLLENVIDIVGPPPRPGGAQMYLSMMSRTFNDEAAKSEHKKEAAYTHHFFEQMQEKGLDLAPGLTAQCIPSLQSLTKLDLSKKLQPYYVGYRHYETFKNTARSNVGPFREIRRKWAKKSTFFNHMPTDGNRSIWKKARRYWAPLKKTKEYITQYEVTEMKND